MVRLSQKYTPAELETLFEQAFAWHESGHLPEAAERYQKLLQDFPEDCELLAGLGTVDLQLGNFAAAVSRLEASLAVDPEQACVLNNLGLALAHLDRPAEALAAFEQAIAVYPDYAEAFFNRGNVLKTLQRPEAALASYAGALALNPNFAACYLNRGSVRQELQQHAEALTDFRQALTLAADAALIYNNCGISLHALQRLEEALLNYDKALALNPRLAEVYVNRGKTLEGLQRYAEAVASYTGALELKPELAAVYLYRGKAWLALQRLDDALRDFEQAIALQPDDTAAHWAKAALQAQTGEYAAAIAGFDKALALNPAAAEIVMQRGNAFYQLKQFAAAERDFVAAIALKPDYSEAYMRLAVLKIVCGDYADGWRLYEWRWQDQQKHLLRRFAQAAWLGGQSVAGKTVLIHPEQGFGDFMQFCRYAPLLQALGAQVALETLAPLFSLMTTLKGGLTVLKPGEALPAFDLHCPIMSLPLAFNTRLDSIPNAVPYLFADAAKTRLWQTRLGEKSRLRVGLVWSGSSVHQNDHNRSIPLALLEPLWRLPIDFHALQIEFRPAEAELLRQIQPLRRHAEQLRDFADTAALLDAMDLVICVDTSVAHLAGAMAKPVWILLPYLPDYRWLLERSDSPWYPSATLFRQPVAGDWSGVIAAVAEDLQKLLVEG